jgi:transcriptional regulator with XRE-family HTH domain
MMTDGELDNILHNLRLTQAEAAQLLGVAARTVRRWLEGEEIPGPAEAALRAWAKLATRHLPWRPDSVSIADDDQDQIARHRAHAINLNAMLERVEARGGPRLPWTVNRKKCVAEIGALEISYYALLNGGFSLATYRRKDGAPDLERDRDLIEDAAYCIAKELRKSPEFGPVMLVYHNRPWRKGTVTPTSETFPSNEAAIKRVCQMMGSADFHDPFIMVPGAGQSEVLWDKKALKDECERRKTTPAALKAVADYTRRNSRSFARGSCPVAASEAERTRLRIEALADKLDHLAAVAERDRDGVEYEEFEAVLRELHQIGFFPDSALLSAVEDALIRV